MKRLMLVGGSVMLSASGASVGFGTLLYSINREEIMPLDTSTSSVMFYFLPWLVVIVGFTGLAIANRIKN